MCLLLITVISFPMTNVLGQEVGQQEQLLTYKDPTFGIEASYPSSWRKIDFNTSLLEPMNVIVGFTVGRDNQTGDEANIFIVVDDIDNRTTIKEYARDKYNEKQGKVLKLKSWMIMRQQLWEETDGKSIIHMILENLGELNG
jgi:hypothetical protein